MITKRINSTNEASEVVEQVNSVLNDIAYEFELIRNAISSAVESIDVVASKTSDLTVALGGVKPVKLDTNRSQAVKTLRMGVTEDADAHASSVYMTASGELKYKNREGVVISLV